MNCLEAFKSLAEDVDDPEAYVDVLERFIKVQKQLTCLFLATRHSLVRMLTPIPAFSL